MTKGLLTSCWGNSLWHGLHSIAYAYNPETDKENYFNFFLFLGSVLPCEDCRIHYKQNVDKKELFNALDSNETFFRYVYDLHNKVNKQTGVPESKWPSYEEIKNRYDSFKASCSEIPGVCGGNKKSAFQKKVKVVEQFGSISRDQLPYIVTTFLLFLILVAFFIYLMSNRNTCNSCNNIITKKHKY